MLSKKRGRVTSAKRAGKRARFPQRRGRRAIQNGELKFHDVDLDDALVATGGTVTPTVNIIVQGIAENQRIGRKVTIRKIQWKYDIDLPAQSNAADITQGDIVRVIMYIDKQTNGATATVTNILESADYQAYRNLTNVGRFRIVLDKTHSINRRVAFTDGTNTASTPEVVTGTFTLFTNSTIPIEYSGVNGTIDEISTNNIGVLLISREGTAGFESKIRLRYSDN